MSRQFLVLLATTWLVVGSVACASNVSEHWGESYREMVARQTAEPEVAAKNAGEPAPQGLDGTSAEDVIGRYRGTGKPRPSLSLPMIVTDPSGAGGR